MAHICEETRLGAAGCFRPLARLEKLDLVLLAFADIARDADDLGCADTIGVARASHRRFQPDIMSVLVKEPVIELDLLPSQGTSDECHAGFLVIIGVD